MGEDSTSGVGGAGRASRLSEQELVLELYRAYREKVTHEDTLVHQRMIWFVTLQALLFTSFAILVGDTTPQTQETWGLSPDDMRKFALIFAAVGMVSALTAALSVGAAYLAVTRAFEAWQKVTDGFEPQEMKDLVQQLPSVVGSGDLRGPYTYGKFAGSVFPALVGLAWLAIICQIYGVSVFRF